MSQLLELKKTPDGRVLARRRDGRPLTPADRVEAKRLANGLATVAPTGDISEGRIIAVLINSPIVGLVWFAFDDAFKSGDDVPVFFASELSHLQKMNPEEQRRRYAEKRALRGGWIRDRVEELTKH